MTSWSPWENTCTMLKLSCNTCWRTPSLSKPRSVSFTFNRIPSWATLSLRGVSKWTPLRFLPSLLGLPLRPESSFNAFSALQISTGASSGDTALLRPLSQHSPLPRNPSPGARQWHKPLKDWILWLPSLPSFSCRAQTSCLCLRWMLLILVEELYCLKVSYPIRSCTHVHSSLWA